MSLSRIFRVFSTCPPSNKVDASEYTQTVRDVARWSEGAGCEGILVYTDNGLVDPWLTAQLVIESTERIAPLVAVQPVYMHPYSVAKMIATAGLLHGRRMWMNMVAGGFRNDLIALGDETEHARRYDRVVEYGQIIQQLLAGEGPVTCEGDFYRVKNLRLEPALDRELLPGMTISGSSDAGLAAAKALGAIGIQYPEPPGTYQGRVDADGAERGIRVGIIAREESDLAWRDARARFPEDRKGQLAHQLAMKTSDSAWHRQLSEIDETANEATPYWLVPFKNYKTFCPYLVGSYEEVAAELGRYVDLGYGTFILDVPESPQELEHIGTVFARVAEGRE